MEKINNIKLKMINYYSGDPKRIHHFLKVYEFAMIIADNENFEPKIKEILSVAALVHDIGIKNSELKYGSTQGKYQELVGSGEARKMLAGAGFDTQTVERVCWLVGHHHTYDKIEGDDYHALVEADFLVNLYEDYIDKEKMQSSAEAAYKNIFYTKTGKELCKKMFSFKEYK